MRHNVLILSAGRRVELLQGFQHALANCIPQGHVFCADMRPQFSAACHSAVRSFVVPRLDDPSYLDALRELCLTNEIGLVIPTIDTELSLLAANREEFQSLGTQFVVSTPELIAKCRDKRLTSGLFAGLGIATPRVFELGEITFPCFTKLFDGSNSVGAMRLNSHDDLTDAMRSQASRMYMELVDPKSDEITIDIYYDRNSNAKAIVPRQRLEVRAGEVNKGITRRDWVYKYLLDRIKRIDGAIGCLTLQLFAGASPGDVKAIEINPRFGGGFPLTLAAGADFPQWLIREYLLDQEPSFFDGWEANLMMLRYDAKVLVHG